MTAKPIPEHIEIFNRIQRSGEQVYGMAREVLRSLCFQVIRDLLSDVARMVADSLQVA